MNSLHFSQQWTRTFAFDGERRFQSSVVAKIFETARGERWVPLAPAWPALLADLEDIGPVAVISQHAAARLATTQSGVEFLPVPQSEEFVEHYGGTVHDSANWGAVLAVEEPCEVGSLFSVQIFDRAGSCLLKLLLTKEANLEYFFLLIHHYAGGPMPCAPAGKSVTSPNGRDLARTDERRFAPAARKRGELTFEAALCVLLAARRAGWELSLALFHGSQIHEAKLTPLWIESTGGALHLFDEAVEAQLFPDSGGALRRVRWPEEWAIEWFDAQGERLLNIRGPRAGRAAEEWNEFLAALT